MLTSLFILQLTGSDRSLMNAFREIGVMADRINLPRKIQVSNLDIIEYKMLKLLQNADNLYSTSVGYKKNATEQSWFKTC